MELITTEIEPMVETEPARFRRSPSTLKAPKAPKGMEPCAAELCTNLPATQGALCPGHRRTLLLTAKISDAVREFLSSADIPPSTESGLIEDQVMEAGEYLAQGLGLLATTQFDEQLIWDSSPIHIEPEKWQGRWRVEFVWKIADSGETEDIEDVRNDEIGVKAG
ncbi:MULTISPECIES: hypothetical protein [Mycolicibacterium]|uniref:Uncharacterized protein n=2 Tax=Mycolicibacterium fortuitum TaxID=1766 RepID=A0AAE5AG79_MYCFO|nr:MULTISPECIES: hypothetical protein [Mycolicibacterium]MCC9185096.1 hypothetical protein [Mycolicibacterium mageritense]MCV7139982.1 hypothetical protein [Mycolicibacterium fortuitum]MDV7195475.1 hypothetical protein [Mycolicibacterium fortuitum]MDV7209381.1 hypothetical protein [Mycolicibacterium fortuitum]MDV7231228.1 hypothetical protein [Mycolicibacterium fortuitum]